jgi:glutamate dehydrogenase
MGRLWTAIEGLDNRVPTSVQTAMFLAARQLVERASRFLLHSRRPPLDVQALVDYFGPGVEAVAGKLTSLLSGADRVGFERRRDELLAEGVPGDLSEQVALLGYHYSAHDIVDVATTTNRPVDEVAEVYFAVEDQLGLSRLRDLVNALPRDDRWHTLARAALRDDLYAAQAALTADVLETTSAAAPPVERVAGWTTTNAGSVERAATVLTEITRAEHADLATLSVALREIRAVIRSSRTS